jgi:hypothetical protein
MMNPKKLLVYALMLVIAVALAMGTAACGQSKADVAAKNLSTQAEQFKIARRIVFFNGITDKYLASVTGYCSVETGNSALAGSLEVTCQTGHDKQGRPTYKKDFFGLSDNVSYMVEQIDPVNVSVDHYTVLFRPQTIVPDIDKNP